MYLTNPVRIDHLEVRRGRWHSESEVLIAGAECRDELRHRLVALESSEAFDGFSPGFPFAP